MESAGDTKEDRADGDGVRSVEDQAGGVIWDVMVVEKSTQKAGWAGAEVAVEAELQLDGLQIVLKERRPDQVLTEEQDYS